ncbi:MAG: type IV pili methyl-accepting chemotaxis transducer N-terminal domain-containing protein, partial [Litoreibacter sp.]
MLSKKNGATHRNNMFTLSSLAVVTSALLCNPAAAQSTVGPSVATDAYYAVESDGADRILLAGKLRTLTQEVAAASCAVTSNVDVEEAHDVLEQATADFDRYIVALRDGDEELHILGPEEDRRIVQELATMLEEWSAIHSAIDTLIADGSNVEAAHVIDDHNLKLLELTSILSADISGRYAHPFEMTAADALMI